MGKSKSRYKRIPGGFAKEKGKAVFYFEALFRARNSENHLHPREKLIILVQK